MNFTLREYFNRLKRIEETLPPGEALWLVSIANEANRHVGGRIVNVSRENAARLIDDGSYRLATDEEAAAEEARQEQAREEARYRRLTPTIQYRGECVVLPPAADDEQPKKRGR